jgi:multicomponent Na+:H+ antiporter subunit B
MIDLVAGALFVFVLVTAIATALLRDVLAAIIVFGAYSLGMALFYTILLAPDVAMTEAAIGAGVTTLLLLLTIAKTVRPSGDRTFVRPDYRGLLVVGLFTAVLARTVASFPTLGASDGSRVLSGAVSRYYIGTAYGETGVENAVTAVLAGYRGFDTFGEAVVVFAAGIATLVALQTEVFTRE